GFAGRGVPPPQQVSVPEPRQERGPNSIVVAPGSCLPKGISMACNLIVELYAPLLPLEIEMGVAVTQDFLREKELRLALCGSPGQEILRASAHGLHGAPARAVCMT